MNIPTTNPYLLEVDHPQDAVVNEAADLPLDQLDHYIAETVRRLELVREMRSS